MVTALGKERTVDTQTYPMHLIEEFSWGSVEFTMRFIALPGSGNLDTIRQEILPDVFRIDFRELFLTIPRLGSGGGDNSIALPPLVVTKPGCT